jgi:DNA mismatch repair protein MSH6
MDADIAVQVLKLRYLNGSVAHCKISKDDCDKYSHCLVSAGYKVARVDETETLVQFDDRKKAHRGKDKPKCVNREVTSILTLGTRTLLSTDAIEDLLDEEGGSVAGPLLAIAEFSFRSGIAAFKFGFTIVDASVGTVTMGQFADDVSCNRMHTLLMVHRPAEVSCCGCCYSAS